MARFNAAGIEGLTLSMKQFSEIPDSVVEKMLDAGAEVTVKAHKASIMALGLIAPVDGGTLLASIKAHKKAGGRNNDFKRYVLVYPTGPHHTYESREKTKAYVRSKHGRTYTVGGGEKVASSDEVGFVQEFGAPHRGIKATQWMKKANESCAEELVTAEMRVYDEWLKSINL